MQSTASFDAADKLLGFGPTMQFFHAAVRRPVDAVALVTARSTART